MSVIEEEQGQEEPLRPSRRTPNLELPVPGDAGPADYVSATGAIADRIDAVAVHPGDLKMTAADYASARITVPDGWLLCNGDLISRIGYPRLFVAIGERYGAGDGETTFALPNLTGRVPVGGGAEHPLYGGEEQHTLTVGELAHHAHGVSDPGHAHGIADPGHLHGAGYVLPLSLAAGSWAYNLLGTGANNPTDVRGTGIGIYGAATGIGIYGEGYNWAHNNMQPFVVVSYLIKT